MTIDRPADRAFALARSDRSYLLRVRAARDGQRYFVQDLKTGERLEFATVAALQEFITGRGSAGLR